MLGDQLNDAIDPQARRPATEMVITDMEQLKAISDPLRLRMVELMGEAPVRGWTAKELAERLGTKQTKLYHHLTLLEERGFIRVAGHARSVSGILEKRYAVVALTLQGRPCPARRRWGRCHERRARRDLREGARARSWPVNEPGCWT